MNRSVGVLAAAGVLAACASPVTPPVNPWTVAQATVDPVAYRSPLPRDVHLGNKPLREAHGQNCASTVTFPPSPPAVFVGSALLLEELPWPSALAAFGSDGYAKAMARARRSVGGKDLFDVRADLRTTSILGVWTRSCIEVHALSVP